MSRILIITPAGRIARSGNSTTARRWASMLRSLGHTVTVTKEWTNQSCDLMIALHARRSAAAVAKLRRSSSNTPIVVTLTGTDLYRDIRNSSSARQSLELADRLIVLQDRGAGHLPNKLQSRVRVIFQSAEPPGAKTVALQRVFEISVSGHLRPVKDPFRAEAAVRDLPQESKIRITHVGDALSESMQQRAHAAVAGNSRYRWLGSLPHWRARQIVARSQALVVSSKMEGGANVISESLVANVPVLASRIDGNIGMLGADYAGYFDLGNTPQLRNLMLRLETSRSFRTKIRRQSKQRAALFLPKRERNALEALLAEFGL